MLCAVLCAEWRLLVQVQSAGRSGMQDSVDQVAAYQELEFWATEAWRLGEFGGTQAAVRVVRARARDLLLFDLQ